jgi:hypothetical protein
LSVLSAAHERPLAIKRDVEHAIAAGALLIEAEAKLSAVGAVFL